MTNTRLNVIKSKLPALDLSLFLTVGICMPNKQLGFVRPEMKIFKLLFQIII